MWIYSMIAVLFRLHPFLQRELSYPRCSVTSRRYQETMSTLVTSLPDDVLSNVLTRLSVRSLCRARMVCRQWNERIKSCEFQRLWIEQPCSRDYYFSDSQG